MHELGAMLSAEASPVAWKNPKMMYIQLRALSKQTRWQCRHQPGRSTLLDMACSCRCPSVGTPLEEIWWWWTSIIIEPMMACLFCGQKWATRCQTRY